MNHLIETENSEEALKQINTHRLNNGNQWVFIEVHSGENVILIKSFNTSIQELRRNGINYPCSMDLLVRDWKAQILKALKG